jgi:hypothetical protein
MSLLKWTDSRRQQILKQARKKKTKKLFARTLLVVTFALFAGCDPGMSIRQIDSRRLSKKTVLPEAPEIVIEVKTRRQLIGEKSYYPEIKIANVTDSPIIITNVELNAQGDTYENKPRENGTYPLTVPARSTAALDVVFRFGEGTYVQKVFKKPAELRVHYWIGDHDGVARTTLLGGSPDAH